MRKRIIDQEQLVSTEQGWLDLDALATVEITSEEPEHPIEFALLAEHSTTGWRAAGAGKQILRLLFDQPQALSLIKLKFVETLVERSQEYSLHWSADVSQPLQEIAQQQWNFSPTGSTVEIEEHQVELAAVMVLELQVVPDISGGNVPATLEQLQLM
ncbi:MAG: carbohydrate-binding protein [Methyloprofundus sp.]|nr:carbohydrate-binding protein [Methyloprofundus sp.]